LVDQPEYYGDHVGISGRPIVGQAIGIPSSNYIRRHGSFNDWRLDEKEFGDDAKTTNKILDQLTGELYSMIRDG
jgi:fructose 1,6-bisphosphatase